MSTSLRSTISTATVALLALLVAGCTSTGTGGAGVARSDARPLAALAEDLVRTAELRTDTSRVKVVVTGFQPAERDVTAFGSASLQRMRDEAIGEKLVHEFVMALANRLNLIETELLEGASPSRGADETAFVRAHGATHVLAGTWVRREDVLDISVRLIEVDTRLITASAQGVVPLKALGDSLLAEPASRESIAPFEGLRRVPPERVAETPPVFTGAPRRSSLDLGKVAADPEVAAAPAPEPEQVSLLPPIPYRESTVARIPARPKAPPQEPGTAPDAAQSAPAAGAPEAAPAETLRAPERFLESDSSMAAIRRRYGPLSDDAADPEGDGASVPLPGPATRRIRARWQPAPAPAPQTPVKPAPTPSESPTETPTDS